MTPDQVNTVFRLATRKLSKAEFEQAFPVAEAIEQSIRRFLRGAAETRDADALEATLVLIAIYGMEDSYVEPLVDVLRQPWHRSYEDIVLTLGNTLDARICEVLYEMTRTVPSYLEWDDNRALARKATYALGKNANPDSERYLRQLLGHEHERVRAIAAKQLLRRGAE